MYQKERERGYDSVNLYDPETQVITVFKKQGDEELSLFTTTCELTPLEHDHLLKSGGNFVTEAVLNNQKALIILNPITNQNNEDL